MDWVDTTDDSIEPANALRQTFEVLRPVPTQATARVQKVQTGKGKDKHAAVLQGKVLARLTAHITAYSMLISTCNTADNLTQAFPPAFPEETTEQQSLRRETCERCWTALSENLEVSNRCLLLLTVGVI